MREAAKKQNSLSLEVGRISHCDGVPQRAQLSETMQYVFPDELKGGEEVQISCALKQKDRGGYHITREESNSA